MFGIFQSKFRKFEESENVQIIKKIYIDEFRNIIIPALNKIATTYFDGIYDTRYVRILVKVKIHSDKIIFYRPRPYEDKVYFFRDLGLANIPIEKISDLEIVLQKIQFPSLQYTGKMYGGRYGEGELNYVKLIQNSHYDPNHVEGGLKPW